MCPRTRWYFRIYRCWGDIINEGNDATEVRKNRSYRKPIIVFGQMNEPGTHAYLPVWQSLNTFVMWKAKTYFSLSIISFPQGWFKYLCPFGCMPSSWSGCNNTCCRNGSIARTITSTKKGSVTSGYHMQRWLYWLAPWPSLARLMLLGTKLIVGTNWVFTQPLIHLPSSCAAFLKSLGEIYGCCWNHCVISVTTAVADIIAILGMD